MTIWPGRAPFTPLKTAILAVLVFPGAWTAYDLAMGNLGARPMTEAIHEVGLDGIRLLFIALAITPLRQILRWPLLAQQRRTIGVAAFCYLFVHFCLYVVDQKLNIPHVASEIVLRIYLTIGFVGLLGLTAMAATSTDGMVRRMGGKNWRRLHKIVYGIGILAAIHFFMQSKLDVYEPTWMAGCLVWLLGYRIVASRNRNAAAKPLAVALLGVFATLFTAVGEALYYYLLNHVDMVRVLEANLDLEFPLRPAWWVLGASLIVFLASAGRTWYASRPKLSPSTA
jgi:methionine sulfoxide reductase heme-binding subunit